jgi:hypothetical protein
LNGAEQSDSQRRRENWENELWSYFSSGDGKSCPVGSFCQLRHQGNFWCFNDETEKNRIRSFHAFVDEENIDIPDYSKLEFDTSCLRKGRIFELVTKLARKYQADHCIVPVPDNLISVDSNNIPIEIRWVSLKANHGAVWYTGDCWLIHLNKCDPVPRARFTLYHEIFHILAHCHSTPVFKKRMDQEINFNEAVADHFAANILLPSEKVKEYWNNVGDANRMAEIFQVPRAVMFIALRSYGLV